MAARQFIDCQFVTTPSTQECPGRGGESTDRLRDSSRASCANILSLLPELPEWGRGESGGPSFLSFIVKGTNKKPFKCDQHFHPVSGLKELPPPKRGEGGGGGGGSRPRPSPLRCMDLHIHRRRSPPPMKWSNMTIWHISTHPLDHKLVSTLKCQNSCWC